MFSIHYNPLTGGHTRLTIKHMALTVKHMPYRDAKTILND
jgi:hypothetical protein